MDLTPYLSALVMFLGIIVGTLINPKVQHEVSTQYGKREILFKKKLEYFEKILETIEHNKRIYHQALEKISFSKKNKEIEKIILELKQNRKKFLIGASPLYFNIKDFSEKIVKFVEVEKEIFNKISSLQIKDRKEIPKIIEQVKGLIQSLDMRGNEIVLEMRKELSK